MKKLVAFIMVLILIFSMCACNNTQLPDDDNKKSPSENNQQKPNDDNPADTKYKLTVIDYWGYLVKPLDESYEAGEDVEVTLAFLSGPSVGIELNGEYIGENADTKYDGACPIITFTMPAKDSVLYTTQNGNIGFLSTFSRAGYGIPNIYDKALNASKLNDSNPRNLPIYKFDTLSDLEKFKSDFGGENGFNYGWDEVPSLNDATKNYDESFFERYTLMLVYVEASSGSYRFGFKDVTIDGNDFCIHVEQTNHPQGWTDDMAGWFITVAIPDSMVANITEFDADMVSNMNCLVDLDDFSFALTWGVYGISSYDSHSGKLVKTTDAKNPEDYITNYQLTDTQKRRIYSWIYALDVYSYPDIYELQTPPSDPDGTLILTVRVGDEEKTIKAEHVSLFFDAENEKEQRFFDTCNAISDLLKATDEWKALPDFENFYE